MESGYGNIAHGAWHLRQLLQSAQEQAFPGCKIGQIPVWTSWPGGRGAFSSSIAFLCAASKKISPAEAADKLSAFLPERDALFSSCKRCAGYLNFYPSLRWYAACAASLLQSASFSAWRLTEEDFGFFAFSSPSVQELQRAFVRLCSVLRGCRAEGMLDLPCPPSALALLRDPQELALLFSLARLADAKGQSILPALLETARAFHRLYDSWRVWSPDSRLTTARAALYLACAAGMQKALQQTDLLPKEILKI